VCGNFHRHLRRRLYGTTAVASLILQFGPQHLACRAKVLRADALGLKGKTR
jgi:hypothetical protein